MLQHRVCKMLWKLVAMSIGPRYLTTGLSQWWYNFPSKAQGNSFPPASFSLNHGCYSKWVLNKQTFPGDQSKNRCTMQVTLPCQSILGMVNLISLEFLLTSLLCGYVTRIACR